MAPTDCDTGVTDYAMSGILQSGKNLTIAAGLCGQRRQACPQHRAVAGWPQLRGLVRNTIVVITDKDEATSRDKDVIENAAAFADGQQ